MPRRVIAGRYRPLLELASGGMASVFFGQMTGPGGFNRIVAIKRLHPHLAKDPACRSLFVDEARLAARIRHANVVPTLDVVIDDDDVFLVMEYVVGVSAAQLLAAARSALPLDVAAKIMLDTLQGLGAAHDARDDSGELLHVVHRDVSPQNVIVGADGTSRVLDFGIAKALGRSQETRDGAVKGKPSYMAPEQWRGETLDARTDVYSAGVMFWELVTGYELFSAPTPHAAMLRTCTEEPGRPRAYAPNIPTELDDVIIRALAKRPEDRHATAHAFADAIEKAINAASSRAVARYVEGTARVEQLARARALEESIRAVAEDGPRPEVFVSATLVAPGLGPRAPEPSQLAQEPSPAQTSPSPSSLSQQTSYDSVLPGARRPSRRRSFQWMIASFGIVAAVGAAVAFRPRENADAVSIAPVVASESRAAPMPAMPPTEPAPAPSSVATVVTDATELDTRSRPPTASAHPTTTSAPKRIPRSAARCTPPWTLSADGVRILKPECQ